MIWSLKFWGSMYYMYNWLQVCDTVVELGYYAEICLGVCSSAGSLQACLLTYILSPPCSCYSSAPTFTSWSLWSSCLSASVSWPVPCSALDLQPYSNSSFWPHKPLKVGNIEWFGKENNTDYLVIVASVRRQETLGNCYHCKRFDHQKLYGIELVWQFWHKW